ncbi:MAG: transporter substrate-binding domain-containing protein [Prevotella sp.]|nr:transporter substrate-binding domain-containing protein [Prevotella sp.]
MLKFARFTALLTALFALVLTMGVCSSCEDVSHALGLSDTPIQVSPLAKELGFSKERPLVMGMNTRYAPLQYVDEKGKPLGYDVEFTTKLMRRMGIPFTFAPNIWDRMAPGIISGEYDMGMMVYSAYRKDSTYYSNAVFRIYYQIVYRKKDYTTFDFRHLKGKKIAYMKSRPVGEMLSAEGAEKVSVSDLGDAFADLAAGKYDGLIAYRFQAIHFIVEHHLDHLLQADELSLEPREYCYASHDKRLIDAINAELDKMEADGIVNEVYGKEVISQFGAIHIPLWVWWLLGAITFIFLLVYSINRYRLSKRLQLAHQRLLAAYDQMAEKNDALLIANERAEESTRMKSAFIKQISHEIRTPLNILSGFTQVLTTPGVELSDAEKGDISKQIVDSTDRITGLVNKMLELSDISSQTVLERTDEVTPALIAAQAVETSGIAAASHIVFNQNSEAGADVPLKTNLTAAIRILELLLDNAIKFTRPAEASLSRAKMEKQERVTLTVGQTDGTIRFVVEDTGIDIPASEAERIFDEFVQLDEYYDGTGIGLSVARSLARRLGGDVTLDTSYAGGARFIMTLPTE